MKFLFLLSLALLSAVDADAYRLSPDFLPADSFEAGFTYYSPQIVLHNEKFVLLISDSALDLSELKKILLFMGYDCKTLCFSSPSFQRVKFSVDSLLGLDGLPSLILIVGDENAIPPYRERVNPYTKNAYSTDYDYGITEGGSFCVSASRIPASSQASLDIYLENLMRFLVSGKASEVSFLSPFYDFDSDSAEDYLYSTVSFNASKRIDGSKLLMETNSPFPKYLYDMSELDDTLKFPFYDWDVSSADLSSDSPLLLAYRGHGNPLSTVSPDISISQISSASLKEGGCFVSFTCLLSAFDAYTSGFKACFAESILFLSDCFLFSLGFSSETFYQYNNFMFSLFFDHYDDAVYAPLSSDTCANLLDACMDCSSGLLSIFGLNDYSICQISSMQILGFPLLSLKKTPSAKPYAVQSPLCSDDTVIRVTLFDSAPFFLSSENAIFDSLPRIAGEYALRAENLQAGSMLFASSYYKGILFVDTIPVLQGDVSCDEALLSDSSGDCDGLIESGESVTFSFSLNPLQDSCLLSSENPYMRVVLRPDASGSYAHQFTLPKECEDVRLALCVGGESFLWAFEAFRYSPRLLSVKSMDSRFIFPGESHQMMLEFTHDLRFGEACTLRIIRSGDYETDFDLPMVLNEYDTYLFFREILFLSDSFDFKFECRTALFTDTLSCPFACSDRNSIFVYDPARQYVNSAFLSFLRDSLKCSLTVETKIDSAKFWPANIFAFGIYPFNDCLDSAEAAYISKSASFGSSVFLDGGDALGYDKAGKSLLSLFGITSTADGATVYAGGSLSYSPFQTDAFADTTVKFVDVYSSGNPFLLSGGNILGSACENRMAQSYPLTKIEAADKEWLYYLYASFILDYRPSLEYDCRINLSYENSLNVRNASGSPVMLKIVSFPSFLDSVSIKDSRIIFPDSSSDILLFLRRGSPGFISELLFTTGFDTMSVIISYSPASLPKAICASLLSSSFVFECACEGEVILPPKASKSCFVKRKGSLYFILGETSCLLGDTLSLETEEGIILIALPQKTAERERIEKTEDYYSILGSKTERYASGIYFSENKKRIFFR